MVICKFYVQGYCRYGDACYYDHYVPQSRPRPQTNYQSSQNLNRFSFTKTLQQINSANTNNNNNYPRNASIFEQRQPIFDQSQPPKSSIFGGGTNKFSFNQALQQLNNRPNIAQNNPIQVNMNDCEVIKQTQPMATSIFPTNSTFQFGNTKANDQYMDSSLSQRSKSIFSQETACPIDNVDNDASIKAKIQHGIYSEMKNLTEKEIDNFKSERFTYPIPFNPPPFEFCC